MVILPLPLLPRYQPPASFGYVSYANPSPFASAATLPGSWMIETGAHFTKPGGRYLGDSFTRASSSRRRDFLLFFLKFSAAWWGKRLAGKVAVAYFSFRAIPQMNWQRHFSTGSLVPQLLLAHISPRSFPLRRPTVPCKVHRCTYKMNKWTPLRSNGLLGGTANPPFPFLLLLLLSWQPRCQDWSKLLILPPRTGCKCWSHFFNASLIEASDFLVQNYMSTLCLWARSFLRSSFFFFLAWWELINRWERICLMLNSSTLNQSFAMVFSTFLGGTSSWGMPEASSIVP